MLTVYGGSFLILHIFCPWWQRALVKESYYIEHVVVYSTKCSSWIQWNDIIEHVSWPLRMCIMLAIYPTPLPPISCVWSQWLLCITLEKLKDMNISIEKAQTKMAGLLRAASTFWWRVSVIRQRLENNNANKGTKQVGFNEMLPSRQYFPLCSSSKLHISSAWRKPEKC